MCMCVCVCVCACVEVQHVCVCVFGSSACVCVCICVRVCVRFTINALLVVSNLFSSPSLSEVWSGGGGRSLCWGDCVFVLTVRLHYCGHPQAFHSDLVALVTWPGLSP